MVGTGRKEWLLEKILMGLVLPDLSGKRRMMMSTAVGRR
jgi:hypothetical protein